MSQSADRLIRGAPIAASDTLTAAEAVVGLFVAEWQRGEQPNIEKFLSESAGPKRTEILLALVKADMNERGRRGLSVSLADYLPRFSELGPFDQVPLELIYAEYAARSRDGKAPDLAEYARRFPAQIAALRAEIGRCHVVETSPPQTEPHDLEPGSVVGDFRIVRLLGAGAISRVYVARQLSLDRLVALKVSRNAEKAAHEEARTLAALDHDHVVPVYAEQIVGDRRLMAMRYVPGVTLAWLMERLGKRDRGRSKGRDFLDLMDRELGDSPDTSGTSPRSELARLNHVRAACHIVAGLARGLDHAHRLGVLHRDIKPANILVAQSGRAMLMDFNIAARRTIKNSNREPQEGDSDSSGSLELGSHGRRSDESAIFGGTPAYMAPEHLAALTPQLTNQPFVVDERSDIYSLGVVFYELLSDRHPFPVTDDSASTNSVAMQMLAVRLQGAAPIPRKVVRISAGLDCILEKCLAPDPNERYRSAGELAEDLQCYLEHRPLRHAPDPSWSERAGKWRRRHPRWVATIATAAMLIIAAVAGETWLEYRYFNQAQPLMDLAYSQWNDGDTVVAFQTVREAERFMERSSTLLPLLGFRAQHENLVADVRRLPSFLTSAQYRRFNFSSGLSRNELALRAQKRGDGEPDSPGLHALSLYQVLTRSDWQQLPQFQLLDPESQADLEADVTEILLLRAMDMLGGEHTTTPNLPNEPRTVAELVARVPAAQQNRYALREVTRLARGGSDASDSDPAPPQDQWETFDLYLMGVFEAKCGRFEQAIRYFDSVLDRPLDEYNLTRYWTHFHRAYCAEQAGNIESAIADYGVCIGLSSQSVWPHHNLALIYARQGKFDLSAKYLSEAAKRGGNAIVSVHVNLSAVEFKLGHLSESLAAAEDAIALNGQCAEAYANRGAAHAALGHREPAIADLKRALELDPTCNAAKESLELLLKP